MSSVLSLIEEARESLSLKEIEKAMTLYFSVLDQESDNTEALTGLGLISAMTGNHPNAKELFKRAQNTKDGGDEFWSPVIGEFLEFLDEFNSDISQNILELAAERLHGKIVAESFKDSAEVTIAAVVKDLKKSDLTRGSDNVYDNEDRSAPTLEKIKALHRLFQIGKIDEAEEVAISILRQHKDSGAAWKVLGIIYFRKQRLEKSEICLEKAISISPTDYEAHNGLGLTLMAMGKIDKAKLSFKTSIKINKNYTDALLNLGNLHLQTKEYDRSEVYYQRAVNLNPTNSQYSNALGALYIELRKYDLAIFYLEKAISFDGENAYALCNLGNVYQAKGDYHRSLAYQLKATKYNNEDPNILNALAVAYQQIGDFDNAKNTLLDASRKDPNKAEIYNNLGNVYKYTGQFKDAEKSYKHAINLRENNLIAYSNLLFLLSSHIFKPSDYLAELAKYQVLIESLTRQDRFKREAKSKSQNLKVGFMSGDLHQHPVGIFFESFILEFSKLKVTLFAYPSTNYEDKTTRNIKKVFSKWKSIERISDYEAAQIIFDDDIDVLIDLSGHSARNRLRIFAYKPAPLQATWLGYFGSTGLKEMDFIIGDKIVTPQTDSYLYSEKIFQLPNCYLCYTLPNQDLTVSSLPAQKNGFITFGCFNKVERLTDNVIKVWSNLMTSVPNSRIYLKDRGYEQSSMRDRIRNKFCQYGISADRISMEGNSDYTEYLTRYYQVDVALSPFPYGGGTTTAEALWMGVPVLVMQGNFFLSRIGESIVKNCGLSNWSATNEDEYVNKGTKLTSDIEALAILRGKLRETITKSPLIDCKRFAKDFFSSLLKMNEYKMRNNNEAIDDSHF